MSHKVLGPFELQVISAVSDLGANAYGVSIRQAIELRIGRSVAVGAVYTTLQRLQAKGFVSSIQGEPTAVRGGRAKRNFKVEAAGREALDRTVTAMRQALGDALST